MGAYVLFFLKRMWQPNPDVGFALTNKQAKERMLNQDDKKAFL
jgi:hypothetical protein